MLSPRQELILRLTVDFYLSSARPVASKQIAQQREVRWGASTVRAELATLELAGYLMHPHTSAGRVPTDAGYRCYVDMLVASGVSAAGVAAELELSRLRREVDAAMWETTAALAQVTDLMALATAPPLDPQAIRGAAGEELGPLEGTLYMNGASRLLSEEHFADLPRIDRLMQALEGRADVLQMLRSALEERSVFCWIGAENPKPELRSVSVIGANYGLGQQNIGSVGVVGPLRMDYQTAIASVQIAARELSRYFEAVYGD
jgi:transcriptional regulator of heat shock response